MVFQGATKRKQEVHVKRENKEKKKEEKKTKHLNDAKVLKTSLCCCCFFSFSSKANQERENLYFTMQVYIQGVGLTSSSEPSLAGASETFCFFQTRSSAILIVTFQAVRAKK